MSSRRSEPNDLPPRLGPVPGAGSGFGAGGRAPRRRRYLPLFLWLTLALVFGARYWLFPDPVYRESPWEQDRGDHRRNRHPPTLVQEPRTAVPTNLWRIRIEVAPADADVLRTYHWSWPRGGPAVERPQVRATVTEGDRIYTNVALHLKGSAGSFRPFDDKPAMTLNFNKHVSGQRFHGLNKLSLNNSVQDPTYLCETIARELFEAAGVPAPRTHHATVILNGRDLGLYVVAEGWGKPFLRRHFPDVSGNLYDGGFVQDVHPGMDTNSGDHQDDHSDIDRLLEAFADPSPEGRWERWEAVLDTERFARFLAMEILTCHWDGYGMNRNNYRLFHDRSTGRMVFLPHGMDQMFGVMRSSPYSSIEPQMQGDLARAFMSHPQGRQQVMERLATFRNELFVEDRLVARVRALADTLRPTLAAYHPDWASDHDRVVDDLCHRIVERARSVTEQLAAPREPVAFDADGVVHLQGWRRHTDSRNRGPLVFDTLEEDGRQVLRIATGRREGIGSWRARVRLDPGLYRFEGRVRTENAGERGGVCLRISGSRTGWHSGLDGTWNLLTYDWLVEDANTEVEFVCEFSGRGEGWFDVESLRLVRLVADSIEMPPAVD